MQGVVNRDIKLENTLLDHSPRPLVKICDFGYSKHEKFQSAPGSRVGTPAYLAPEVILTTKGKTYDGKVCSSKKGLEICQVAIWQLARTTPCSE